MLTTVSDILVAGKLTRWKSTKGEHSSFLESESLPFSSFHILDIEESVPEWVDNSINKVLFSTKGFSLALLWSLTACLAGETKEASEGIEVSDYLKIALDSLDNGEDSGLLFPGSVESWKQMNDGQKEFIEGTLEEGCKNLLDFPELSSLNVISTFEKCTLKFGSIKVNSFIPVITETSKGIAGIIPIFSSDYEASASLFTRGVERDGSIFVENIHVWNLEEGKIYPATQDRILEVEDLLVRG